MVDQADQLAEIRLSPKIEDTFKGRVMVSQLSHLDKQDMAAKMIDHVLIARRVPPFDGVIELAAGVEDPERYRVAGNLLDLRHPGFLQR